MRVISSLLKTRDRYAGLNRDKKQLIETACRTYKVKSFADLGGVWAVDAGYTFYALNNFEISKTVLVDTNFTDEVLNRAPDYLNLEIIEGNFGQQETIEKVGDVDAAFFFDTLLHQVNPDWNQVLELYAPHVKYFLIF